MAQPAGIAIDKFGNLYFADSRNNCVRKIDTYGIITTVAGIGALGYSGDGASATDALLSSPFGVAMDTSGNLYIADWENKRIRKVNTSGIIRTVAGTGYIGYSGDGGPATHANFMGPSGVAVDRNGNIFVADRESNRVRKIDNAGTITTVAGNGGTGYFGDGGPATSAQLYYPQSIAVNNVGAIYIADAANNRIRYVTNTTSFVTVLANENFIVYPNPAKNTLYFDLQSADKGTIRLMDITGRVMVSKLFSGATSFDISGLEPGIYLYQVLFDDGLTKSGKVVIEK